MGSTADGSAATALLPTVTTGAGGTFNVTGMYTCPASNPLVYITATGGNPGLAAGTNNSAVALMAVLGPCQSLTASTNVVINELTTVAAVFPLAPFMSSLSSVGASTADAPLLTAAFTLAEAFVDPATGQAPGPMLPSGTIDPVPHLNTLANIVAACINSAGGVSGDNSACGNLFLYTPAMSGGSPTDTIAAMLNAAKNPTANTTNLFNLPSSSPPFQPQLSAAPADMTPKLTSPGTLTVTPTVLNFPDTQFNATSAPMSVTVSNNSNSPAYATMGSIVGTNAGDFTATSLPCEGRLDPGASCTLSFTFTPSGAGSRVALAKVGVSTAAVVPTVQLQGRGLPGTPGDVSLWPATLTPPGSVQLRNNSNYDVVLSGFNISLGTINGYSLANLNAGGQEGTNTRVPYTQTSDCPTVLPAQAYCTITVGENGEEGTKGEGTGLIVSTLTVVDSAASSPQTATLSKNYTENAVPRTIDFGTVGAVASPAAPATYNASVDYTKGYYGYVDGFPDVPMPSISGPDAAAFSTGRMWCPGVHGPGCYATVTFSPTEQRSYSATLQIGSITIPVRGTGGPMGANFSLIQFNPGFQSSTDNTPPSSAGMNYTVSDSITVFNNGSTSITPSFELGGASPGLFTLVDAAYCMYPLASGYSCGIQVLNTPHTTASATLIVTDTVSGLQKTIPLTYTYVHGTYPPPNLTGPATVFPTVHVGATPPVFTLTANMPYGDAASFTVSYPLQIIGSSTCAYGASTCQIQVAPKADFPHDTTTGLVTVTDLNSSNTATLALTSTVGIASFTISPTSFAFGGYTLGHGYTTYFTLTNTGDGFAACPQALISGPAAADFSAKSDTTEVDPLPWYTSYNTCRTAVSFAPTQVGNRTATLTFSNATLSVSGYGYPQ